MFLIVFIIKLLLCTAKCIYISDYGACVNGETNNECVLQNGYAFFNAMNDAFNNDYIILKYNETIFYVPNTYDEYVEPIIYGLSNVTLQIDGHFVLHNDTSLWKMADNESYYNAIDIRDSNDIVITGSGIIDGQGYTWWKQFFMNEIVRQRPTILNIENTVNILIKNIAFINSPRFNIFCDLVMNMEIKNIEIFVNANAESVDVFPYNTDGIDFRGINIHIHDINIMNYDDSVAVKPTDNNNNFINGIPVNCTQNALIENINVYRGVGMSIGSVPSKKQNCVKNITFKNIYAYQPIKFIYIKTGGIDSANTTEATIEDITYINMTAYNPLLWAIYIGPQQQEEPDGTGSGFFPIPQTNPYVTIKNISLKNIYVENSNYYSGLLMCNISNPCQNINFENVSVKSRELFNNDKYKCSNMGTIYGTYDNSSYPPLLDCGLEELL